MPAQSQQVEAMEAFFKGDTQKVFVGDGSFYNLKFIGNGQSDHPVRRNGHKSILYHTLECNGRDGRTRAPDA